jgi:hypothetical protein
VFVQRLAELAQERKERIGLNNKALLGTLEQTATSTTTSTTQVKTQPSSATTLGEVILQIRMVGGATIKHTFKATDTMQVSVQHTHVRDIDIGMMPTCLCLCGDCSTP